MIRLKLIDSTPSGQLKTIITIPSFNESNTIDTLQSLRACDAPDGDVEVIVLFNHSATEESEVKEKNKSEYSKTKIFIEEAELPAWLGIHILRAFDLEPKKAGVGTARKILMDEAARRLIQVGHDDAPIVGLDADTLVSPSYLKEIIEFFDSNSKKNACSIQFQHQLEGLPQEQKTAIQQYESHLRYYVDAQRWAGFPFAFQTIGSAMAVRCKDYIIHGGMNRRKAGEDFYFLQKYIELGKFGELNSTCVYPSGRISDRVPFGTGKAVGDIVQSAEALKTYHIQSFMDLKIFFESVPLLYGKTHDPTTLKRMTDRLPDSIQSFLNTQNFISELQSIEANVNSENAFIKRFFRWFNAFRLMKFLHYARDHFYPNMEVYQMIEKLKNVIP